MTKRAIFILILLMLMCNLKEAAGKTVDPEQGVPRELARLRAELYRDVRYRLTVVLA